MLKITNTHTVHTLSRKDAEAAEPEDSLQDEQRQMHIASYVAQRMWGSYMTGENKYYAHLANYTKL